MLENIGKPFFIAEAADDVIVSTGPAILLGIIFGEDVSGAVVEISDSKEDGDEDVKFYFSGDELATSVGGLSGINATFQKGIAVNLTNQTNVTLIWKPAAV